MKILNFTSQWKKDNIGIQYQVKNSLHAYFIVLFFKNWTSYPVKSFGKKIEVRFGEKSGIEEIKDKLFTYHRVIEDDTIITYLYNINWARAFLRSCYKFIVANSSVVGLPELYLAIVRKSILEPIEYYQHLEGWSLIHSSVFTYQDVTFAVVAESKAGKSTLIKELVQDKDILVLSDNYAFLKGDQIKTIEEPLRSGAPKLLSPVFYGRSINGYPEAYESKLDIVIFMSRKEKNQIQEIDMNTLIEHIRKVNEEAQEGIAYLTGKDRLKSSSVKPELDASVNTFELSIAEGLENIEVAVELILKLSGK